jgi:branched-chain amino acid aminotransferase
MSATVYFRNAYVPAEQATVSIQNHAFLYGTSLFEGIRGYWLEDEQAISVFRASEHFERLINNCRIFGMNPGHSLPEMMQAMVKTIELNAPQTDTYIRPTVFKDIEQIGPGLTSGDDTFCLFTRPLGAYVAIDRGLSVCVSSWRRLGDNMIPPRAKASGAYMNTALIKSDALRNGFDDAIVLTEAGRVSEGSAMNLFLVRNGKLVTPAKTENILEGITRDTMIELAQKELGLEVEERQVDRTELYVSEEAFFCGTGAQVAPITQIDKRPLVNANGEGAIGPISEQLQSLYFKVVKNQLPAYSHWCTLVPINQTAAV